MTIAPVTSISSNSQSTLFHRPDFNLRSAFPRPPIGVCRRAKSPPRLAPRSTPPTMRADLSSNTFGWSSHQLIYNPSRSPRNICPLPMAICIGSPHRSLSLHHHPEIHLSAAPIRRRRSAAVRRTPEVVRIAAARRAIDGVTEELNAVASQCLDTAAARRRVRAAFLDAQQLLDHFLFKMAPSGIQMEERYETNSKGVEIFWKSWLPKLGVTTKASLFFCHGYGDTCTFFFEGIAKRIAAAGYGVYAMDLPGFGLSEGLHGYIHSFDEMVDHVIEQYACIRDRSEVLGMRHFLLGQSMGGAVALKVHLKKPKEWDGVLLVAPMCKIAEDVTPPAAILNAFSLLAYILPEAKLFPQKDLGNLAFRDPQKRKLAEYNVISYADQMRLRTAVELIKATRDIESQLEKVSSPLLILHGAADKVTDPNVSKFLFDKASTEDKTLKFYEGGYHAILEGEPDERISTVIDDIISWLDSHVSIH